jgi:pimeloyl-ACP methyl ester carboxylesterase
MIALLLAVLAADEFDSKGVAIRYAVQGRGEPVVLIHGYQASGALNWDLPGVTAKLAARYRVVTLDCRGHGRSGKPEAEDAYGIEMVEDVVRLLDHLKIEKAHLAGYSMGGLITLKFAVRHPGRVRSLVLGGMGWMKNGTVLEKLLAREGGRVPAACARGFSDFAVTEEELKAIQVPGAVIVGDRDPARKAYVEPLSRVRPDWPVTTVEGAGHMNCVSKEAFQEALQAALDAASAE